MKSRKEDAPFYFLRSFVSSTIVSRNSVIERDCTLEIVDVERGGPRQRAPPSSMRLRFRCFFANYCPGLLRSDICSDPLAKYARIDAGLVYSENAKGDFGSTLRRRSRNCPDHTMQAMLRVGSRHRFSKRCKVEIAVSRQRRWRLQYSGSLRKLKHVIRAMLLCAVNSPRLAPLRSRYLENLRGSRPHALPCRCTSSSMRGFETELTANPGLAELKARVVKMDLRL